MQLQNPKQYNFKYVLLTKLQQTKDSWQLLHTIQLKNFQFFVYHEKKTKGERNHITMGSICLLKVFFLCF